MGINWSNEKIVKNKTLVLLVGTMPNNKVSQEEIWNLWRMYKDEIKKDGFTIAKDSNDNKWKINYYHAISKDSFNKNITGQQFWRGDFEIKIQKWKNITSGLSKFNEEKTSIVINEKSKENGKEKEKEKNDDDDDFDDSIDVNNIGYECDTDDERDYNELMKVLKR